MVIAMEARVWCMGRRETLVTAVEDKMNQLGRWVLDRLTERWQIGTIIVSQLAFMLSLFFLARSWSLYLLYRFVRLYPGRWCQSSSFYLNCEEFHFRILSVINVSTLQYAPCCVNQAAFFIL